MKKRLAYLMACSLLASPLQATLTEAGIKADLKADLEVTLNLDYPVSNYEKMELKATLLSEDNKVVATMPINSKTARIDKTEDYIVFEDIPLGRMGSADEVAAAIEFLASDKADYITGQVLGLNGGFVV